MLQEIVYETRRGSWMMMTLDDAQLQSLGTSLVKDAIFFDVFSDVSLVDAQDKNDNFRE